MEKLQLEEKIKLKTLCEFLFFDLYQNWATYERFEKCFQPLFNNIEINLYNTFVAIVGQRKKYITYPRFLNAYLNYKKAKENKDTNNSDLILFFDNILNNILKSINNHVGEHKEFSKDSDQNRISFSTKRDISKRSNIENNESFLSKIQVLIDKLQRLRGIMIEYDDSKKFELYPKEIKKKLLKGLEINLDIINKDYFINNKKQFNDFNYSLYRDSITHIFGSIDKSQNVINFLGFKCVSGKLLFIGIPEGDSFLFGEFGKKFYNLRIEMIKDEGISYFEPGFIENERKNYYLKNDIYGQDENIFEEECLKYLDEDMLNQTITTTIIEEKEFNNQKTSEEIPGYDYKEVIHQTNRNWIINKHKNVNGNYTEIKSRKDAYNFYSLIKEKSKDSMDKTTCISPDLNDAEMYTFNYSQNPLLAKKYPNKNKGSNPFFKSSKKGKNNCSEGLVLHKTVALVPKKNNFKTMVISKPKCSINDYKGKINKDTKPNLFLKKMNFRDLKEKLTKQIYDEFYSKFNKINNENESLVPFNILNEFIPNQIDEREEKIKQEEKPNKKEIKLNGINVPLFNEVDDKNNHIENGQKLGSDAYILGENIGYDFTQFKTKKERNKNNENNNENIKQKWQSFSKRLGTKYTLNLLLQTIWNIIKAKNVICRTDVELKDKIKCYKILTDENNEKIINFLAQDENKEDDNDDDDDIIKEEDEDLIPDKNPEIENSLEDIEKDILDIKNLINNPEKKEISEMKILKKSLNYLNQQKNILIENITNKEKDELIDKINEKMMENSGGNFQFRVGNIFGIKRTRSINWIGGVKDDEDNFKKTLLREKNDKVIEKSISKEKLVPFHKQTEIKGGKDDKFIPDKKSLCPIHENKWDLPSKVLTSDVTDWELIDWERYKKVNIFSNNTKPEIDNIRQGEYIGDCYFLSALGSLCGTSDNDNYLKNSIGIKDPKSRIFFVKLNINGKWKEILIDNYFPIITNKENGSTNFCFGSSFQKELWVSLFEKAWAKINGCYARIGCGGFCGEAFDVLTDAFTESYQIIGINDKRKKELWDNLYKAKNNKYVICAGTRHFGMFESVISPSGLVGGHAYTIINIYHKTYKNKDYKLVKLRNPWGEKEFNGDWSDNSDRWKDPELRKIFEFVEAKDDGIFYMSYDDFLYYYRLVEILKISPNYTTIASCKIKKTEVYRCQIIRFRILRTGENKNQKKAHVFINLYQKNPRIVREDGNHFPDPVKGFIIIAQQLPYGNYKYIKSVTGTKSHIAIEADLEIDQLYLIFCDVNYRFVYDEIYGYNITFYSNKMNQINVKNITYKTSGTERSEILGKVLYDYYEKMEDKENKAEKMNKNDGLWNYFWSKKEDKIDILKLKNYNEDFPFIILILKYNKNMKNRNDNYFRLELNNQSGQKNNCIYNDVDASEFDKNMFKKINHDNTVVLIMGYSISDVFNFTFDLENKPFEHPIFKEKYKTKDNDKNTDIVSYCTITEDKKGFILGLENKGKKDYIIDINLLGLFAIDLEYQKENYTDDNIHKLIIKRGQKKIINLRIKPFCKDYRFDIKYQSK